MGVQCRSIATWTGCVAATALEGGHALHTSTQPTRLNSAQVHGGSSQHQGGRVDDQRMLLVVTLQYFHPMESSTVTSAVVSLGISLHLLMVIAGVQTSKAPISMASVSHMEILVPGSTSGLLVVQLRLMHIYNCPCVSGVTVPSFVGEDYFCETGNDNSGNNVGIFFVDDPIWDGQDCGTSNTCECTLNNPPWFCKQLPQVTTDDIEVRICGEEPRSNEDTPVELIELYVR